MNLMTLVGRAASEAMATYYESGAIRAAVLINIRRRDGSCWQMPLEAWGKTAQQMHDACRQGRLIGVIGEVAAGPWKGSREAEEVSGIYLRVDRFEDLEPND